MPRGGVEVEGLIAFELGGDGGKDALPVGFHFGEIDSRERENSTTKPNDHGWRRAPAAMVALKVS